MMSRSGGSTAETEIEREGGGQRNVKRTVAGLVGMLALGMALLFTGNGMAALAGATAFIIAAISLAILGMTSVQRAPDPVKQKRGLDGQDMYTLIDRMVDDLDDDEKAYLRRRLEQKDDDLPQRMSNLLDYREEERQAGRRG